MDHFDISKMKYLENLHAEYEWQMLVKNVSI